MLLPAGIPEYLRRSEGLVNGITGTARIITVAAAIMIAVFAAFIQSTDIALRVISMATAM